MANQCLTFWFVTANFDSKKFCMFEDVTKFTVMRKKSYIYYIYVVNKNESMTHLPMHSKRK